VILPSLLSAAAVAAPTAYLSPYLWRYLRVSAMRKKAMRNGTLVLTYDDGPSDTVTPRLLDILAQHDAHATFFMLGCNARLHPSVADRVLAAGHEIGCHTDRHLNAWKVMPRRALADIATGYETLSRWVAPDGLFRPPYGKITLPTACALSRRRAALGWWTIDSGDTRATCPPADTIVRTVERSNGGVVLMHDLARTRDREDFICDITYQLLSLAKLRSWHVMRLGDFVHDRKS
jgi:peptidoglycan/xylan/chitin deacetylase (PgdA/CDA1 family)